MWDPCGIYVESPVALLGSAVILLWYCRGLAVLFPVVFLWYCCGITVYGVAVEMLWYYGYIVAVSPYRCGFLWD